jgi:electron transfer flavoprotein alpha subunit
MLDTPAALLVVGRCDSRGAPDDATAALLAVGIELASGPDDVLCVALLIDADVPRGLSPRVPRGAQVSLLPSSDLKHSEGVAAVSLAGLAENCSAALVLLPDDVWSREVAARMAGQLVASCAIGCRGLSRCEGQLRFQRDIYGGAVTGVFVAECDRLVATVATASVSAPEPELEAAAAELLEAAALQPPSPRVFERGEPEAAEASLEGASRIVSGGRGVGGAEGFEELTALAGRIDAQLGASRPPCDAGWVHASRLVGITGRTVTPELYLAVGISGSAQHRSGMGDAKTVVAVNSDAEADIFRFADYGVVGDWREVVAGMLEALRASAPEE